MQVGDTIKTTVAIHRLTEEFPMADDETYLTDTMIQKMVKVLPVATFGKIVSYDLDKSELIIQFNNGFLFQLNTFYEDSELDDFGLELVKE